MPVRKFRDVEPHWRSPGDPELLRAMAALWEIGRRTRRGGPPPGVHKFASVEELQQFRESWAASLEDDPPA